VAGRRVDSSQARAALQLITAFERSQMSGLMDIQTIDVLFAGNFAITTSQGTRSPLAVRDLDRQLREWHMVHEQAYMVGKAIATLDLSWPTILPPPGLTRLCCRRQSETQKSPTHPETKCLIQHH